ncbi:hypothetical protein H072_9837 [Dactylellina haptotyla CBS 200.50]|uniref:Rhodanese domain-containing protein n=1 Tax=Dactylellina haptotyla (strain CBS 200.50) TaxID=1284197 RepID=S8BBR3_DACHA|nr:hypothetical protein H072_9837 [Dactylellina haptotyla CBS 200.50]
MLPIRSSVSRSLIAASKPSQSIAARACASYATRRLSSQAISVRQTQRWAPLTQNFQRRFGVRAFSTTPVRKEAENKPVEEDLKIVSFEDVQALSKNPKPNRLIVDVREPHELQKSGVIPNSINVPLETNPEAWFMDPESFEDKFGVEKPSTDTELIFSCKAGIRSNAAARIAKVAGYENTASYKGSWLDWAKNTGAPTY